MTYKQILVALTSLLLFILESEGKELLWKTKLYIPAGESYIYGCQYAVHDLNFGYTSQASAAVIKDTHAERFEIICNYPPAMESLLLCIDRLIEDDDGDDADGIFRRVTENLSFKCDYYANVSKPSDYYYNDLSNATKTYIQSDSSNVSETLYQPVYPNMTTAKVFYDSYVAFYTNFDNSTYFGSGLLIYFAVIMLIATVSNILTRLGMLHYFQNTFINHYRSYITLPAILPNGRHARPWGGSGVFSGLFPDRSQALICFGYLVLHIGFLASPYNTSEAHAPKWGSTHKELQKYLADRTGIMAFAQVPLVVLFAGRNNILIHTTGFNYQSFIHFHKLIARTMFFDALIHAICYTINNWKEYSEDVKELYFRCGIASMTLIGCIWLFSLHPIRSRQYEIFLYTHIAMVLCFLVAAWYHCRNNGACEWLVAACTIWTLDRVIRIIKLWNFGYRASVITVINDEMFKVVTDRPENYRCKPGQYGFLYFSDSLLFFQNHPFTIFNEGQKLVMYVKVKQGITRDIYNELVVCGNRMVKKICIEGPYGQPAPVRNYDHVLLITAGAGIPGIFDYAYSLAYSSALQTVKFIWIHKSYYDLKFYLDDLLVKLKNTKVEIDVYLTRDAAFDYYSSSNSEEEWSMKPYSKSTHGGNNGSSSLINIKIGRPDMHRLLASEIRKLDAGSLAVVAAGPPDLVDNLKYAVSKEVLTYEGRMDYFSEYQIW